MRIGRWYKPATRTSTRPIPPGPARFWLFTLKALAFIGLRRGERETATQLITQLRQLDPAGHLGFGVVEALLQRSV
ncbi:hypothetical protein [Paraburkholderia sp. BL9I2N2]|uniref:hypothetical protein n=1 Tax=Paraburkholderia sp. BL9I2N2 TaxID=1938809 RepID=UPI003261157F